MSGKGGPSKASSDFGSYPRYPSMPTGTRPPVAQSSSGGIEDMYATTQELQRGTQHPSSPTDSRKRSIIEESPSLDLRQGRSKATRAAEGEREFASPRSQSSPASRNRSIPALNTG